MPPLYVREEILNEEPRTDAPKYELKYSRQMPLEEMSFPWKWFSGAISITLGVFAKRFWERRNRLLKFRGKIDDTIDIIEACPDVMNPTIPSKKAWSGFERDCQEIRQDIKKDKRA